MIRYILAFVVLVISILFILNTWQTSSTLSDAIELATTLRLIPEPIREEYILYYCQEQNMEPVTRLQTTGLYGNLKETVYCANAQNESFVYWDLEVLCFVTNTWNESWCEEVERR